MNRSPKPLTIAGLGLILFWPAHYCLSLFLCFPPFSVITFVAQLDPALGAASSSDLSQLTIFNTFRTCRTTATKVAPLEPVAAADDSTDPASTELSTNSTASANSTELPRDAFVGDYAFE